MRPGLRAAALLGVVVSASCATDGPGGRGGLPAGVPTVKRGDGAIPPLDKGVLEGFYDGRSDAVVEYDSDGAGAPTTSSLLVAGAGRSAIEVDEGPRLVVDRFGSLRRAGPREGRPLAQARAVRRVTYRAGRAARPSRRTTTAVKRRAGGTLGTGCRPHRD